MSPLNGGNGSADAVLGRPRERSDRHRPAGLGGARHPEPGPGQVRVRVRCAACAAPTCTWPRATSQPRRPQVRRATSRRRRRRARPGLRRFAVGDRIGVAWLAAPTAPAASAAAARRTCAGTDVHRLGLDGGYAEPASSTRRSPTPCPPVSTTSRPRRCCAPASSATARCAAPTAAGRRLGIYGFGGSAHLTAQIALARACGCTF